MVAFLVGECGEKIPQVQFHVSKIYAKAGLKPSSGSLWPRAQLILFLLEVSLLWMHQSPALTWISSYLVPPSPVRLSRTWNR